MKLFGGKRHARAGGGDQTSDGSKKKLHLTGLQKGLLLLAAAIVVLVVVVVVIWKDFVRPPELPTNDDATMEVTNPDGTTTTVKKPGVTVITSVDEETGEEIEIEYEIPGSHKEGYYNILVMGTDDGGNRTDTIMIARMDANDHTVALMSIPRDTLINGNYAVPKINGVYGANGKGEKGIEAVKKQLTAILGFEVDGYVMVDLEAFIATVDLLGGVTFNVPQRMYHTDPTQDLYIDLYPGEQLLDGQHAMQLVRFRGYGGADIERTKVQQDFIKALAKKCLSLGTITKIKPLIEIFIEYVDTDLTLGNMVYFAQELLSCDFNNMYTVTLPGTGGVWINGGDCYSLYPNQVLKIVNEYFNPYDTDIPRANLHIRTGTPYTPSTSTGGSDSGSSGSDEPTTEQPPDDGTGVGILDGENPGDEAPDGEDPGTEVPDGDDPSVEVPDRTEPPAETVPPDGSGGETDVPADPDPVIPVNPPEGGSSGIDILDPGTAETPPSDTQPADISGDA